MKNRYLTNKTGVTLVELLVALVICGLIVAGMYRVFIAQSRAYTVQDQVAEVQQNVRSTMEIVLRDFQMIGFDRDERPSVITVPKPPIVPDFNGPNSIRIFYQFNNALRQVDYWRDASNNLCRQQFTNGVSDLNQGDFVLLRNVNAFNLMYGADGIEEFRETQNGSIDDRDNDMDGDVNDFVTAATLTGENLKVIAVRIELEAEPTEVNPDLQSVSPRRLTSIVNVRNHSLNKKEE